MCVFVNDQRQNFPKSVLAKRKVHTTNFRKSHQPDAVGEFIYNIASACSSACNDNSSAFRPSLRVQVGLVFDSMLQIKSSTA